MYPENVKFLPFVGKSYYSNPFNRRIMVLGDSHYGSEPSPDITKDVINTYLNPDVEREGWMNTFVKFERSMLNHQTSRKDSAMVWNSLLFYNFLQVLLTGPREAGTNEQYAEASVAFFEVLDEYKPDVLIVWGKRLWSKLPNERWEEGDVVSVEGYTIENGFYRLSDGHKVRAFCVYHPSTGYDWGYWYKVISHFLSLGNEDVRAIDCIGFTNFRKFTEFPSLPLGNISYLVGANNAGKSTFDKATVIFLDFLKSWLNGNFVINFSSPLCRSLNITSYKDAFCNRASYDSDLSFSAKIGRYEYCASFAPTEEVTSQTSAVSARYVRVIDTLDNRTTYTFTYEESLNNIKAEVLLPVFDPSDYGLDMMEKYLNSPICSVEKSVKEQLFMRIDSIHESLSSINYSSRILSDFTYVEDVIGEDVPKDCLETFLTLKNAISQLVKGEEKITIKFTMPRNSTIKDFFAKVKLINKLQADFDETSHNNVSIRTLDFCPIINLCGNKTFNVRDTDSVSQAVCNYGLLSLSEREKYHEFICSWLKKFEIGSNLILDNIENEVFKLNISKEDGVNVPLTTLGTGSVHLVVLILTLVNFVARASALNKHVVIIEEPGINLHPNKQSLLADFFSDFNKEFGIQLIVETHSEYLVRKMQVLVARLIKEGKHQTDINNDIKVYYFQEGNTPYKRLSFKNNGRFDDKFGEGFYDEAVRSTHRLTLIERED